MWGCSAGLQQCEGAWGCSWGCSDCGSSWGGSEAAATAAARLGLQLASVVAASSCRRRLVAVVASLSVPASDSILTGILTRRRRSVIASSRHPSPPLSSPATCEGTLQVVAVWSWPAKQSFRSTIMSSPVMSCIPSPQPCSPRHSRHWWQPRSLEVATESESDCRPARRMRCRGRGPRTNLACVPIPGPLPSPHREAQPAIGVRVGVDRGGGLPGWFFGRQGEDQSEDRSEDRSEDLRRIGVRIGVRIEGGSE